MAAAAPGAPRRSGAVPRPVPPLLRGVVLGFAGAAAAGCYGHLRGEGPSAERAVPPPIVAPMRGRYAITRAGEPVGEERFTITASGAVWRARGVVELRWPVEQRHGYVLEVDRWTLETRSIVAWLELLGERQSVRGAVRGAQLELVVQAISGDRRTNIAWGPGTALDFGSPVFNAVPLARIAPRLTPGHPVAVRTVLILVPVLEPVVLVENYALRDVQGGLRRIAVGPGDAPRPIAMWVRADGLPVRVRTWVDDGPPFELRLEDPVVPLSPSATASTAAPSR